MKGRAFGIAAIAGLLLALFLPVYFSIIFIGNNMNYNADHKIYADYGNKVLLALTLIGVFAFLCLIFCMRKIPYTKYTVLGSVVFSAVICILFYIVNVEIAKCIAFYGGWDCGTVANSARWVYEGTGMQYGDYYSIYTNNVPITWLLHELYSYSAEASGYPYNPEFIWIQFQCAQHAAAIFLSAMTMLIISRKISGCLLALLVNIVLLGLSPWKVIPYTDASTIVFPIAVIFLYALFLRVQNRWKYPVWFLLTFVGLFGGVMKATCYVALIAVVLVEFWMVLCEKERFVLKAKSFLCRGLLLACAFLAVSWCKEGMYRTLGYQYDYDMDMGWIPCLYVGLNEETTGACSGDGLEMVRARNGSRKESSAREWKQTVERAKEKGFNGLLDFWRRKQVMTYNDGTFSWFQEGFFNAWEYENLTDSKWKEPLRAFYWKDGKTYHNFVTWSQGLWLFVLTGVIAEAAIMLWKTVPLLRRRAKGEISQDMMISAVMLLCFVGIFLFLTLFEGRARYLYNSIAVFAVIAVMGYHRTVDLLTEFIGFVKRKRS